MNIDQQPPLDIVTSDRVTGDLWSKMDGDQDNWGLPTNTGPSGTIFGRFKVTGAMEVVRGHGQLLFMFIFGDNLPIRQMA